MSAWGPGSGLHFTVWGRSSGSARRPGLHAGTCQAPWETCLTPLVCCSPAPCVSGSLSPASRSKPVPGEARDHGALGPDEGGLPTGGGAAHVGDRPGPGPQPPAEQQQPLQEARTPVPLQQLREGKWPVASGPAASLPEPRGTRRPQGGRFLLGRDSCPGGRSPGRLWKRGQDRMVVPGLSLPQTLGTHNRFLFLVLGHTHRRPSPRPCAVTSHPLGRPQHSPGPGPQSQKALDTTMGRARSNVTVRCGRHAGLSAPRPASTKAHLPCHLAPVVPRTAVLAYKLERSPSSGRVQDTRSHARPPPTRVHARVPSAGAHDPGLPWVCSAARVQVRAEPLGAGWGGAGVQGGRSACLAEKLRPP